MSAPRESLRRQLSDIAKKYPKDEAIAIVSGMLRDEYERLDAAMRKSRSAFLQMNVEDPSRQNEVADLRLEAVESYQAAYTTELFLAGLGVDIFALMPKYEGKFAVSSTNKNSWDLSVVSLKESAMRTLGGHCNVVGDIVVLDRLLYDHSYLASVMKLSDDYKPGKMPAHMQFDFYTVVFDEEINSIVKMSIPAV